MYGDVQDRGAMLPAGVAPFSQQYMDTAQKGYQADMAKPRRAAMQDLEQQYNSRGLQNSGLGAFAKMSQQQNFADEDAGFRQNLGMKAADLGERNREVQQSHDWAIEDRDNRAAALRAQMDEQQQQQLWGTIGQGVGTLAGSYFGGPMGGAAGGMAGKAAGEGLAGKQHNDSYDALNGSSLAAGAKKQNPYGATLWE